MYLGKAILVVLSWDTVEHYAAIQGQTADTRG